MKKLLLFLMLIPSVVLGTQRYATQSGAGTHDGTSLANAWSVAEMHASYSGGDTINCDGLWTSKLAPNKAGSASAWTVFRTNPGGTQCSVYASNPLDGADASNYTKILGIAFRTPYDASEWHHTHYLWIDSCRFWGPAIGSYWMLLIDSCWYARITSNFFDREALETIDVPQEGDGLRLEHNCRYFTIENNTFTRVSHATIGLDAGVHGIGYPLNNAYGIVRNNTAYWNHTGPGESFRSHYNLFEGNTTYWNGHALARGGGTFQMSGGWTIFRFNRAYNDSAQNTPIGSPARQTSFLTMSSSNNNLHEYKHNRVYNNVFWGYHQNTTKSYSVMIQDDSWEDTDNDFSDNDFINNIFGGADTSQVYIQYADIATSSCDWVWKNNNIYQGTQNISGKVFTIYFTDTDWSNKTLAEMEALISGFSGNFNKSPGFYDSTSRGQWRDFQLAPTSEMRNAGIAVTTLTETLADGRYEVDSVDYTNNRIVFVGGSNKAVADAQWVWFPNALMSWERGDSVLVRSDSVFVLATWNSVNQSYTNRLQESYPDIGALEYTPGEEPPAITYPNLLFYRMP